MRKIKDLVEYILKHSRVALTLYRVFVGAFFRCLGIFCKTEPDLILFSGHGKRYNDSPRAIYEYLVEKKLTDKYRCVWAVDDPKLYHFPIETETVIIDTFKYFILALKAKYWVCCVNIERGLKFKKRNTVFLNTWHGASINWCGNAVGSRNDFDFRNVNFLCISGEYERPFVIRDFRIPDANIIATGLPRNDELYGCNESKIQRLKEKLGLPSDKKIILYAPTWRDSKDFGKDYQLCPPINWSLWEERLGAEYVLLLRTHPYTTKLMNVSFNSFIRNFTNYPKINDLLMVSDILISDYSSTILDFCILSRPIICFGYDYDEYVQKRGFYFDLNTTIPGGIVRKQEDVLSRIIGMDFKEESIAVENFKKTHIEYGGDATKQCVEHLLGEFN